MAINEQTAATHLATGFGRSELANITSVIAMDPDRLKAFVQAWNSRAISCIGDIIVPQLITRSILLPSSLDGHVLSLNDSATLHVVRFTCTGTLKTGDPLDLSLPTVDIQTSESTRITAGAVPVSQIAANGLDSWLLPVPVRLPARQVLTATFQDAEQAPDTIASLYWTAHCVRLAF